MTMVGLLLLLLVIGFSQRGRRKGSRSTWHDSSSSYMYSSNSWDDDRHKTRDDFRDNANDARNENDSNNYWDDDRHKVSEGFDNESSDNNYDSNDSGGGE
jgi:hypothetical protein